MRLRWYQQEAIDAIWGNIHKGNIVVSAPTGSGRAI